MKSKEDFTENMEKKETLFFKEIIKMVYEVNRETQKAELLLTFILTTKSEEKKYKSIIKYEDVSDYNFKNTGSLIFLMQNLCMVENKENLQDENKKYHIFDPDNKGNSFECIDFFCGKAEVISLTKLD